MGITMPEEETNEEPETRGSWCGDWENCRGHGMGTTSGTGHGTVGANKGGHKPNTYHTI